MKLNKLSEFTKGWFIGNFHPTLLNTDEFEVGIKHYKAGDREETHYHQVATETTVIVSGKVLMNGNTYNSGDIITIEPGEATDFHALVDTITAVVKVPCVKGDKCII